MSFDWYRRHTGKWLELENRLKIEAVGALALLSDTIHKLNAPLVDNAKRICGLLGGIHGNKWNAIKGQLIGAGAITVEDGKIDVPLLIPERKHRETIQKESRNAQEKSVESRKNKDLKIAEERRGDKRREDSYEPGDSASKNEPERIPSTSLVLYPAGLQITASGESEIAFERFWQAYPLKRDKTAARAAWAVATTVAPAELIIDRAAVAQRCGQYYCKPSTWLDREGWCEGPEPSRFAEEGEQLMEYARAKDAAAAKVEEPLLPPPGRFASALEKLRYEQQQEKLAVERKGIT